MIGFTILAACAADAKQHNIITIINVSILRKNEGINIENVI